MRDSRRRGTGRISVGLVLTLLARLLVLPGAVALSVAVPSTPAAQAAVPAGYVEYFIAGDEQQLFDILRDNDDDPTLRASDGMHAVIGVTSSVDGVDLYYDHWEDGYDWDPAAPAASADELRTLDTGNFTVFESANIPIPRTPQADCSSGCPYDGRDRIIATDVVAVTRASWGETIGTVYALAWEVLPTVVLGTTYTLPAGTDLDAQGLNDFESTYAIVQATEDDTTVTIGGGPAQVLQQGETTQVYDPTTGDQVVADKPVQVQLVVGAFNSGGTSEGRSFTLYPDDLWSSEYYAPVADLAGTYYTDVYVHNPGPGPLDVTYEDELGTATFTVADGATVATSDTVGRSVPANSGAVVSADRAFYALSSVDAERGVFDWGYALVPSRLLTQTYYIGWAPGSTNLSENCAPIWVTGTEDSTQVFVDFDGDGVTDQTRTVDRLQTVEILDTTDNDQSGTILTSSAPIAVAYGESAGVSTGSPCIDLGYTVLPIGDLVYLQLGDLVWIDVDGDGTADPGEPGLGGARLEAVDAAGDVVATTTTLANGFYRFDDLLPGTYTVRVVASSIPAGFTQTADPDGTLDGRTVASGRASQFIDTLDFGYEPPPALSILKSAQRPGGGALRLPLQPGDVIEYSLQVYNGSSLTQTDVTVDDAVPTGTTYVPGSSQVTAPDIVAVDYLDTFSSQSYSGSDGATAWSSSWTEFGDDNDASGDDPLAGDVQVRDDTGAPTYAGTPFVASLRTDGVSGNGLQRTVDLTGYTSATLDALARRQATTYATDVQVSYDGSTFTTLTTLPAGDDADYQPIGPLTLDDGGADLGTVTIRLGPTAATGNASWVSFDDVRIQASRQAGTVTGPGGDPSAGQPLAMGYNLRPGDSLTATFQVTVDSPASVDVVDNAGTVATDQEPIPISATTSDPIEATLGDLVFLDVDGDGTFTSGVDRGLQGARVTLTRRSNGQPYSTVTDASGAYLLRGLPAGTYDLTVTGSVLDDKTLTTGNLPYSITLAAGQDVRSADFGYLPPPSLDVTKTSDVAGPVEPGQTITYTVVVENIATDTQTGVRIDDLVPSGTSYVPGSSSVTAVQTTSVQYLDTFDSQDFDGDDGATIWATPWREVNESNGALTGNVRVETDTGPNPDEIHAARSNASEGLERDVDLNGFTSATLDFDYRRAGFQGTFRVQASYGGGPFQTLGSAGNGTDGTYNDASLTLSNGGADLGTVTIRFLPSRSAGTVWWDDVEVTASRRDSTTSAGGDLAAGDPLAQGYTLAAGDTLTATFQVTADDPGTPGLDDPMTVDTVDNTARATSDIQLVAATDTVSDPVEAIIGDLVFRDEDGNGAFDGADTGIDGATVRLFSAGGDGTFGTGDDVLEGTGITSGGGAYRFDGLAAGTYEVRVDETTAGLDELVRSTAADPLRRTVTAGQEDLAVDVGYTAVADLSLTKAVDAAAPDVGQDVVFTIELTNAGPSPATGVTVADLLPAGLAFVGASATQGSYDDRTGTWDLGGPVAVGTETLTVTATATGSATTTNIAEVATAIEADPDSAPGNGDAGEDDQAAADVTPRVADLRVTKSVDDRTPQVGGTVVFTVTVTNDGPDDTTGVTLSDPLPAGLTYVSDTTSQGGYVSGSGAWTVGALSAGATATLTITATADGTGPTTNTATVTASDTFDDESANDSASAGVDPQVADLRLAKTVDQASPDVGTDVTFTLTLDNDGPDDATGVEVTDLLPAGLSFVSAAPSQGGYDDATGTWTVGTVGAGAQATLDIVATATTTTDITNTAEVTASEQYDPDSTPGNGLAEDDRASVTLSPQDADLSVTKTVDDATPDVGDQVTFTVTLDNAGGDAATNVAVTDQLPAGLDYDSHDLTNGQGSYDPTSGVWTVGTLAVGASVELAITATVTGAAVPSVGNTAQVSASDQVDPDSTPANGVEAEDDQQTATVTPRTADLAVTNAIDDTTPNVGQVVTFTVTVTNQGADGATGVRLSDPLPAGVTFLTARPDRGTYTAGVWDVGALAVGETLTLEIDGLVSGAGTYTNTAQVAASDQYDVDSTPANDVEAEDDQQTVTFGTPNADLSLTKTVDDTTPNVGDTVRFTLTVTNGGPDAATGIVVDDLLPAGLTFSAATATLGSYDPATGEWSVGILTDGLSATLTIDAIVTAAALPSVDNRAQVGASDVFDPDSTPANGVEAEDDQQTVTVTPQQADLAVTKSVDDPTPNVGDTVRFTIGVANTGPDAATGVTVDDLLPTGLTFVAAGPSQGTYDDATGAWTVGTIANGAAATLTIDATVGAAAAPSAENTATVSGADQHDPDPSDDRDTATVTPRVADLAVTKSASTTTPNVGDTVTFAVVVTNDGPDTATGVEVTDLLPAGLTYASHDLSAGQGAYVPGSGVWTVGSLASGASSTLSITATVTASGSLTNVAEVTAADQLDPDSTPGDGDPAQDDRDTVALTVPAAADLSLVKTVDAAAPNVGDDVTFTLTVANDGPDGATGVTVTDLLPAGLAYVGHTGGSYDAATGLWTVGAIASGATASLDIVATVTGSGAIGNVAEVMASDQYDPDSTPGNGLAEDDRATATLSPQRADLAVTKTVSDETPNVGDTVVFSIELDNLGPDAATGVAIADALPAELGFVSAVASSGSYDAATGRWTLGGPVASGGTETLTITASVDSPAASTNTASVATADQQDPDPSNDSDSADVRPATVDLAVTKTVSDPTPDVGDDVVFTVTLDNLGPDDATGVLVRDLLPAAYGFVSASASVGGYAAGTGAWTVPSLASGATGTLTITATVLDPAPPANTATVESADQYDPVGTNDSDSASVDPQVADLELTKTVSPTTPDLGDQVTFTIRLDNRGPDPATGIEVTDVLPAGTTLVTAVTTVGTYSAATGVWDVGTLAASGSETLTLTATVDTFGPRINTAELTAVDTYDPDSSANNGLAAEDDQDSATVRVREIDLELTNAVDDATPDLGDDVTYDVVLTNRGPDAATGVTVEDLLPPGVSFVSATTSQGAYVSGSGIWDVGGLGAGGTATLTIVGTVTATGVQTNTAQVASADQADTDSTPGNGLAAEDDQQDAVITVGDAADLRLTKTVDDPAPAFGDRVTFTVSLANDGPDGATGVQVRDLLPAGLTVASATTSAGTYDAGTGLWDLGPVAAGATATLTIAADVDTTTAVTNTAEIVAANAYDPDSTPGNAAPGEDDQDSVSLNPVSADLAVTKSASDPTPAVRDTVTFTVTVDNLGPDAATGVSISDVLPAGVTYVSAVPDQGAYNPGTGLWSVGTLASGASVDLAVTVTVDASGTITNAAAVSAIDQSDPDPSNDAADATLTVAPSADLELTKSVTDATPDVGDTITYTVSVRNTGPDDATNVAVEDVLPPSLTLVGSSATTGTYAGSTWTVGTVAAGSTATLTLTVTVDDATPTTNTAEVAAADQDDPDSTVDNGVPTEDDQAAVDVTPTVVDLSVAVVVDDPTPSFGDAITFTVTVTNDGPDAATGVQVSDVLPPGLVYAGSTPTQGSYVPGTGLWDVGTLPAGAATTLTIDAIVDATGTLANTAQVAATDQFDIDSTPGNSVAAEDDQDAATVTVPTSIDLSLSKTVDDATPDVGTTVTFTIDLGNAGPDAATGVEVDDLLPAGLTFLSASATQGAYDDSAGTWTVGSVARGATATLTVDARVDGPAPAVNVAEVAAADQPDADSTPGNGDPNEDDRDTAAVAPTRADLSLTKTVDDATPALGQAVQFTVTVTNDGPDTATGVEVTDQLPSGLTFVSDTTSQGAYDATTGRWGVGDLAAGSSATLTVRATVDASGTRTNTAEVTGSDRYDPDSTPGNGDGTEDDQASVDVVTPTTVDLELTTDVDDPTPPVGTDATFTVRVRNVGPDDATGVTVGGTLPAGLTLVSATPSLGTYDAASGTWTLGDVPSDATTEHTLDLVVTVDSPGTKVYAPQITGMDASLVDADSTPGNGVPGEDDQDSATVEPPVSDLVVTKTVDDPRPNVGDVVRFTVTVRNDGPDPASSVAALDDVVAGFAIVSASTTQGTFDQSNGVWSIGTLADQAVATLTIDARVLDHLPLPNTAAIEASDSFDPDPSNDAAGAGVDALDIDVSVDVTVDAPTKALGEAVTSTVTIRNDGADPASGVRVRDVVPTGIASATVTPSVGTYDAASGIWDVGALGVGETATVTIAGTAGQPGTTTNTAEVIAHDEYDVDSVPGNGVASEDDRDAASFTVADTVDLELTGTVDDPTPAFGQDVTFTFTVANLGPSDATGVDVTDVLPAGLAFVRAAASQGSYDATTGRWDVGALAAGSSRQLTLVATRTATGTATEVAEVTAADQVDVDSTPANDAPTEDDRVAIDLVTPQTIDLSLTKTASVTDPNVGDDVTFALTVRNAGPDTATNVEVTDQLPVGVTFVAASATQGSFDAGTGVWTIGALAPGASADLALTVRVVATGDLVNVAEVTAADQVDRDSTPGNGSAGEDDRDTAALNPLAVDLQVVKTASDPTPAFGDLVTFTVDVSNLGPDTATDVAVEDVLPGSLDLVGSVADQGAYDVAAGAWLVGDLPAGGAASLDLTVRVVGTGAIDNTAAVTAVNEQDTDPSNDRDRATLAVPPAIDLSVVKTVSATSADAGDTLTFDLIVRNAGPDPATGVAVSDPLPPGVTPVGSTTTQGTFDGSLWDVGDIAPGATVGLTVTVTFDGTGDVVNTAEVAAADQVDIDSTPGNGVASEDDQDRATVRLRTADLSLLKTVSDSTPILDETIVFTVDVANAGPDAATAVVVGDVLPAGLTLVASAGDGSYSAATGAWSVGTIPVGATRSLDLTVRVDATGTTVNTAEVRSVAQPDPDSTPDDGDSSQDDLDTAVIVVADAIDLSLDKTVDDAAPNVGDDVTFTLALTNDGPDDATGVTVEDPLPPGVSYVSASGDGAYDPATGTWSLPSLAATQTATIDLVATVTTTDAVQNVAEVSGADQADRDSTPGDGDPGQDDRDSVAVTPQAADLALTKTVDDASPSLGDQVTFTLTVTNGGPDAATGVEVTDVLPAGLSFDSASSGAYDPATGRWSVGTVAAGGSATLGITATVTGTAAITNTAEVTAVDQADPDSTPGNGVPGEDDRATVGLNAQEADLSVAKTADVTTARLGETITYTVTLDNAGPNLATAVAVTDRLPVGATFTGATADQGSYDPASGVWSVGDVAAGSTVELTITAQATTDGTLTNTAQVSAVDQTDPDSTPANDDASEDDQDAVEVAVPAPAAIGDTVYADLDGDGVQAGEPGIANVTVQLRGPGPNGTFGDADDVLVATDVTDAAGRYRFDLLDAGSYRVDVVDATVPPGYVLTGGADPTEVALAAGEERLDVDLGYRPVIDLAVTMTVDDPAPTVGSRATFTVTVTNESAADATGVQVTDALPAGVALGGVTPSQGTYDPGTGTWDVGSLPAGVTATLELVTDVVTSGTWTDTAEVTAADQVDVDSTPGNGDATEDDQAAATIDVPPSIDLELDVAVDDPSPAPGADVTFTVTLTNRGPDAATAVTVDAPVPAQSTYVASGPSRGTFAPGTGTWDVGSVGAGETVTLRVTVEPDVGASVLFVAQVSAAAEDDVDSTPANDVPGEDDQDSVGVNSPQADLALTKTVDDPRPDVGDQVTFTVVVENLGPDTATSVAALDDLVTGFDYVGHTVTGGTYDPSNGVWSVGSLPSGAGETLTLTATVTATAPVTNVATIESNDSFDPDPDNDTDSAPVDPLVADLELVKSVDDATPEYGQQVTFTLTLIGQGPDPATGVVVQDVLPAGLTFVSAAASQGVYDDATGLWDVGTLTDGTSETLAITASVDLVGTVANVAQIHASDTHDPDSRPANDAASEDDQDAVSVTGPAPSTLGDLIFTDVDGDGAFGPGDRGLAGVSIEVYDVGPDATPGTADDVLVGVPVSQADGSWSLTDLPAGTYLVDVVDATLPAGSVTTTPPEPRVVALGSGEARLDVDLGFAPEADLSLTKAVDDPSPVHGTDVTFTLTVDNAGGADATGVTVSDPLPAGLDHVSSAGDGSYDPATGVWDVGTVTAGGSAVLLLTATASGSGTVDNVAEVATSDQADPDSTPGNGAVGEDDHGAATITIVPAADLRLDLAVSDDTPFVGDDVTLTVVVTNDGPDATTGVTVAAPLPAGLTYGSHAGPGTYDPSTGVWTIGGLAVGASVTLGLVAEVATTATTDVTAEVATSDLLDPDSTPGDAAAGQDDLDTVTLNGTPPPALDLTTTGTDTVVLTGTVAYPHTLTNVGGVPDDVTLTTGNDQGWTVRIVRDLDRDGVADPGEPAVTAPLALAVGESVALVVVVDVPAGTAVGTQGRTDLTATSGVDPTVVTSVTDVTDVIGPVLGIEKTVEPTGLVRPGDEVRYTLTVRNGGSADATGVTVVDDLPAGLDYLPDSTVVDGTTVADDGDDTPLTSGLSLGVLSPGDVVTIEVSARITAGPGTVLDNVAAVRSAELTEQVSSPATLTVIGDAGLRIAKSVTPDEVARTGDELTWSLEVRNTSTLALGRVRLMDQVPDGTRYLPDSTVVDGAPIVDDPSGFPLAGGVLVGPLAPGEAITVTFVTVIEDDVTAGTAIENVGAVETEDGSDRTGSNQVVVMIDTLPRTGFGVDLTTAVPVAVALLVGGWALLWVAYRREWDEPTPGTPPGA